MDFVAVVDQVLALLLQRGRVAYRMLKRRFQLDDEALADLKIELIDSQRLVADEQGTVLVWTGAAAAPPVAPADSLETAGGQPLLAYTPPYLAEQILTSRTALEGERKQVTVLFADLKWSRGLCASTPWGQCPSKGWHSPWRSSSSVVRPLQVHCHRGLGALYAQAGWPEQAHTALSTAIALYWDMGMTFWLPQAEAVLAQVETQ